MRVPFSLLESFKSLKQNFPNKFYRKKHIIFMIYYILSPISKDHDAQKQANHRYITVIISIKNKQTKQIIGFQTISVSMSLLPYLAIGDIINEDGNIEQRTYKEKVFTIHDQLNKYSFETVQSDPTLLSFFKNGNNIFNSGLQNELFLKFSQSNNSSLYIPVIEVIKYFYIGKSKLIDYVLSPARLSKTFSLFEFNEEEQKYYLNLNDCVNVRDKYNIFYFVHNKEYAIIFNKIVFNWMQTGILQAPIPFNPPHGDVLELKADYVTLGQSTMILKIINSNHMKVALDGINLSIYHPKENIRTANTDGKETVHWHRRQVHTNREIDTDAKTDTAINPEYIYDESLDEINEWEFSVNEERRQGEEYDSNLKTIIHPDEDSEIGLSTNEGLSRGGTAARMEIDRENLVITTADPIDLAGLIEELIKRGFKVSETDGIFEDRVYEDGTTKGRAQAYADPELSVRRRYKLLTVSNKEQLFYLLDAQEREPDHFGGGEQNIRPGLLVFPDTGSENFEDEYVKLLIANIVMNCGTWFTRKTRLDKISPIDAIYEYRNKTISLRHIQNPKNFADSVLRAVDKLKVKNITIF